MRPYPDVPVGMRLTDQELHEKNYYVWPDEKTAQLIALKRRGFTWAEIAVDMNIGRAAARKKYYKMRDEEER